MTSACRLLAELTVDGRDDRQVTPDELITYGSVVIGPVSKQEEKETSVKRTVQRTDKTTSIDCVDV
ncbi:hypothetical protein OUZ56_007533 [Daphnia magna]|uniref:Uncharacterized protein n=1 Tax=Daphnia magna TaxID=35525 RepID=A0ABR0AA85_9CRUS|nr:hypothetical protein OUZ56_007533 [Daphnia magna]